MLLTIIIMVFITTGLLLYSLMSMLEGRESPVDRLQNFVDGDVKVQTIDEFEKKERKSWIKAVGKQLEKIKFLKFLTRGTSTILIQADIPLTGEEFTVIQLGTSSVVAYFLFMISGDLLIAIAAFIGLWMMSLFYIHRKKAQRVKKFNDQLSDALVLFSNSLKAGYSYLQAVSSIAKEMPDPVSKEFGRVLKEMSLGMDATKTLLNMLDRVDSEDLKLMVTAIVIQKETGGNLAEILDNIAGTIRDRIRLQAEIKTLTAQGKLSGIIVACVPVLLGLFLYVANKPYMIILFTEPLGIAMLGAGILNEFIGIMLIAKIIKIEM